MIQRTDAIVLRKISYSESSLILTLFTRHSGKVSVMAKGAKRVKSKFGAALQPLSYIQVVYYKKDTRELQNLSDASIALHLPNLHRKLEKIGVGMQLIELTHQVLEEQQEQPLIFNLLLETLIRLDKFDGQEQNMLFAYRLKLLACLGFSANIQKADVEAVDENGGWFVPSTGQILPYGSPDKTALKCSRQALRSFAIFAKSDLETAHRLQLQPETQREIIEMTDLFLQKHLEDYKSLKSAKVLSQMQ